MLALQALGSELEALSKDQLKKMQLPDNLAAAIADAQRFAGKHEALRRQRQYVGKLMRSIDPEPIRAQLDALRNQSAQEVARTRRLETLRDEFMANEKAISRILETFPAADIQQLRTLRRNAIKEQSQQKPPRAYREIFRVLRAL